MNSFNGISCHLLFFTFNLKKAQTKQTNKTKEACGNNKVYSVVQGMEVLAVSVGPGPVSQTTSGLPPSVDPCSHFDCFWQNFSLGQ